MTVPHPRCRMCKAGDISRILACEVKDCPLYYERARTMLRHLDRVVDEAVDLLTGETDALRALTNGNLRAGAAGLRGGDDRQESTRRQG